MKEKTVNQNLTCLLEEISERLKHIFQEEELNMDHIEKLLDDKNRMENLIMHVQYLLDNELYCDLILSNFMVRWKPLIDSDIMELVLIR